MDAQNRKRKPLLLSLLDSKTHCPSLSPLSATVSVRPKPSPTAPSATTGMARLSVASVSATKAAWDPTVSALRGTTTQQTRTAAVALQVPPGPRQPSAAGEATVSVGSASATAVTSAKCGANCASATTSTVCATKENSAQDMAFVTVASASVTRIGKVKTVTVRDALTPACPAWGSSAVGGASACVGRVSAPSPEPMGPLATSVQPALMPAQ